MRSSIRTETFITTVTFEQSPQLVWNTLKSSENVTANKPLLLRLGLPVPQQCKLQGETVGGKRTCYFDAGYIEETITEWNPPQLMKMEVTEFKLPGSQWFGFKSASYKIHRGGDLTVVIRETTITSRLSPAWYWRPLERLGVESEHNYLFEYVRSALEKL